jgi:phage gp36-like protein
MKKQRIEYTRPLDALIAITKRLCCYEQRYNMESELFYHQYQQGQMEDSINFVEWANDYLHYLNLRQTLEQQLRHAA